ncbi:unnamed protein product [Peniophora sp. CBMAI 1063]|nr:unnamed protein product [Peniophora sp. CBMAI 1063]
MSADDPMGLCCLVAVTACADVCTAACIDFTTVRQSFTACFMPKWCRCSRSDPEEEDYADDEERARGEREPLLRPDLEEVASAVQPRPTMAMAVVAE